MGTKHAPLAVIVLTLLLVLSSCGPNSGREGDDVMEAVPVTFRLTIHGDPPPDEGFLLGYGDSPADVLAQAAFCGDSRVVYDWYEHTKGESQPDYERCEEGRTYTLTVNVYAGFVLSRVWDGGVQSETFIEEPTPPAGGVYSATYTYP